MKTVVLLLSILFFGTPSPAQDIFEFDYPTYLALQYGGELEVPPGIPELIAIHLAHIGQAYPEFEDFQGRQEWEPGQVDIGLTDEAFGEYMAGGFPALRELAGQYQCVPWASHQDLKWIRYKSLLPLHSVLLAELFAEIDGVKFASPHCNGCVDGSTIELLEVGEVTRYLYRLAWGDCMMGCYASHYWEFGVSGGSVTLLDEWGNALAEESTTWGTIKATYR